MADNQFSPNFERHDLFDEFGRRVPPIIESPVHKKVRRRFICVQPEIKYDEIYSRISQYLQMTDNFSVDEFESRAEQILDCLRADKTTQNITNGVGVPFFLPRTSCADIGTALETDYLPAVANSYRARFPNYEFVNHNKEKLSGALTIVSGSRHERLLEEVENKLSVGYYFPCLSEYSVPAAIAQLDTLPQQFLLGGGFDICSAFIGSPELLLRTDGYPPLIWLTALKGLKNHIGYHFEAYGYNLTFNRRSHRGEVAEYWASGLTILG
jgi:hypothetical protein